MAKRRTSALHPERGGVPGWVKYLAGAAVLAVIAGMVVYVNTGSIGGITMGGPSTAGAPSARPSGGSPSSATGSEEDIVAIDPDTGQPGPAWSGPTTTVDIYVDGWSWRTLGDPGEIWAATDVTEAASRVRFAPVTAQEAQEALERHPKMVAAWLGRMATPLKDVACADGACAIAGEAVDAAGWMVNPGSIPHWGRSYQSWGMQSGLYKATVVVPEESLRLYLEARDWTTSTPVLIRDTSDEGAGGRPSAADSENGWKEGGYMFSAAFGLYFPTTPDWIRGENAMPYSRDGLPFQDNLDGEPGVSWEEARLLGGLSDTTAGPSVQTLNPSQLTYMSSPTSGCGVAVLCVPATIDATVEAVSARTETVCDADDNLGSMTLTTAKVTATLEAPSHLSGVWAGIPAGDFDGARQDAGVMGFSGYPPLAEGTVTWRQAVLTLKDARGGLVAITGSRNDAGPLGLTALDVPTHFGGEYRVCQSELVLQ